MILLTIVLVAGLHSLILYLLRKRKTFFIQILASIGILYLLLSVLPNLFIPEIDPKGANCGLPIIGIYFPFFLFGIGATVTIFMLFLMRHINSKIKK